MYDSTTDSRIHIQTPFSETQFRVLRECIYSDQDVIFLVRNIAVPKLLTVIYNTPKTCASRMLKWIMQPGYEGTVIGI